MIDTFPTCRWRTLHGGGSASCSSNKIRFAKQPFDPDRICRGCELCDHNQESDAERALRRQPQPPREGKCCGDYSFEPIVLPRPEYAENALMPLSVKRFDESNFLPELKGARFNASLIRFRGRELLAWRLGAKGSSICLTEFVDGLPGRTWPLQLKHRFCGYGREDPRAFLFRGDLHVSFTGVAGTSVCVLYAQLLERDGEWTVNRVWYPDFHDRQPKEKNWGFFEGAGHLYAVYSLNPLVLLHVDGSNVEVVSKHEWRPPWQAGMMRGGASPVRVCDEMYCWFHGVDAQRTYTVGVMTFDGSMRPRRCSRWPVIVPDHATRPATEPNSAWYVCGAYLDGDEWVVSGGVHNSWIEVRRYKAADVEHSLEAVS